MQKRFLMFPSSCTHLSVVSRSFCTIGSKYEEREYVSGSVPSSGTSMASYAASARLEKACHITTVTTSLVTCINPLTTSKSHCHKGLKTFTFKVQAGNLRRFRTSVNPRIYGKIQHIWMRYVESKPAES